MAGNDDVKHDTVVTWNWFRLNVPTIMSVAAVGLYVNNSIINLEHRVSTAETLAAETAKRLDSLSNTMINNVDLIRRDVNRTTTSVEVLSAKLDFLFNEELEKTPRRRSRPGGPISPE